MVKRIKTKAIDIDFKEVNGCDNSPPKITGGEKNITNES